MCIVGIIVINHGWKSLATSDFHSRWLRSQGSFWQNMESTELDRCMDHHPEKACLDFWNTLFTSCCWTYLFVFWREKLIQTVCGDLFRRFWRSAVVSGCSLFWSREWGPKLWLCCWHSFLWPSRLWYYRIPWRVHPCLQLLLLDNLYNEESTRSSELHWRPQLGERLDRRFWGNGVVLHFHYFCEQCVHRTSGLRNFIVQSNSTNCLHGILSLCSSESDVVRSVFLTLMWWQGCYPLQESY